MNEAGYDPDERRKYVSLTEKRKALADIYSQTRKRILYPIVLFDLDGVIFEKPWDNASDRVSVSTWDLLFKKLNEYDEHERLKNMFINGVFEYDAWTRKACRFLQTKGLSKQMFYEVIDSRRYNPGVKETLKTLLTNNVTS